jgi:peptidyl-prolyl cis-trans isomerase A (cyclophilin A)
MVASMRRFVVLFTVLTLGVVVPACADKASESALSVPPGPAPDSFHVAFETSRGTFVVAMIGRWSPQGVERFHALMREGFFDEARFFRVIPGFIAQFGANGDPKITQKWDSLRIADEPAKEKNLRGTMAFAADGADSRTHQLFINLKDNPHLDAQKFVPVGRVIEGMSVVDSIYSEYGNKPDYHLIATIGNSYLYRMFPKMDFIKTTKFVAAGR